MQQMLKRMIVALVIAVVVFCNIIDKTRKLFEQAGCSIYTQHTRTSESHQTKATFSNAQTGPCSC